MLFGIMKVVDLFLFACSLEFKMLEDVHNN